MGGKPNSEDDLFSSLFINSKDGTIYEAILQNDVNDIKYQLGRKLK